MKLSKMLVTSLIVGTVGLLAFICITSLLSFVSPWLVFMLAIEPWASVITAPSVVVAMLIALWLIRGEQYSMGKVWIMGIVGLGIVRLSEAALLRIMPFGSIFDITFIVTRLFVAVIAALAGLALGDASLSFLAKKGAVRLVSPFLIAMFIIIDAVIVMLLATLPRMG